MNKGRNKMRCELCGSKKDVRWFSGKLIYKNGFTECRECFDKVSMGRYAEAMNLTKAEIEEEWERGKTVRGN